MNTAQALQTPARRTRFQPRLEILDEMVAGLLWLQLDLPGDVGRDEIQDLAHQLVSRIRNGVPETSIAAEIATVQSGQFCRPANLPVIRELTRRSIEAVEGAGASTLAKPFHCAFEHLTLSAHAAS
jgi:hypothetical protein